MGKPSGIRAARHLQDRRRSQRWADKKYNKVHLGSVFKSNPFGGASHAKGIVVEKVLVSDHTRY
jgi:small subunit ribosomal protein S23e